MGDRRATRALVLGLLSLPFGVFAPFAVWTAIRSLGRIRASKGDLRGATRAAAGLVAGVLGLASFVVGTAYWFLAS
ncbi:MAG TPA: DUF4190 domain-containing protein [Candidatus Dormibacteraeota bacterium]|nr:DUF4190 domain-containing protein [Candidatus Dormibacteraeota bacterium]